MRRRRGTSDDADDLANFQSRRENAVLSGRKHWLANLDIEISRDIFHLKQLFFACPGHYAEGIRSADLPDDTPTL